MLEIVDLRFGGTMGRSFFRLAHSTTDSAAHHRWVNMALGLLALAIPAGCSPGRETPLADSATGRDVAIPLRADAGASPWVEVAIPGAAKVGFSGVWGSGPSDVWMVGAAKGGRGFVARNDGSAWKEVTPQLAGRSISPRAIWGTGPADVWIVGFGGATSAYSPIWHYDGQSWSDYTEQGSVTLTAVWGSSASDIWAVGMLGAMRHFDGKVWTVVEPPTAASVVFFHDVWGSAQDDVWLSGGFEGGGSVILHYDGTAWAVEPTPSFGLMRAIDGVGKDAVWAAGGGAMGEIANETYKWQVGHSFPNVPVFMDLWVAAAQDVWVAGQEGVLGRLQGGGGSATWTRFPSPTTLPLYGIWGSSTRDVWAVGTFVVLHYTGP